MARRLLTRKDAARPDDWAAIETFDLADGSGRKAVKWQNVVTGEEATLAEGKHPFGNPNAIQLVESADNDDSQVPADQGEETAVDRVAVLLESAGNAARAEVKIYRVKDDGTESWCMSQKPEEFETGGIEAIARKFGPGRYRIILYATHPTNNKFVRRGATYVEIDPAANPGPVVSNAIPGADNALVHLLTKMNERLDRIESAKPDPAVQMASMFALMKDMREAMGISPQSAQSQSPVNAVKELAATLAVMKEIRKEIEPPAPPPDDPLSASLPALLAIVGQAVQKQGGTAAETSPQPAPVLPMVNVPADVAAPINNQSSDDEAMMQLKFFVSMFNKRAANKESVEESAEQVYEFAPDELIELIQHPQWFEQLAELVPTIEPHRVWYEQLRVAVLKLLAEDQAEGESDTPQPGKS